MLVNDRTTRKRIWLNARIEWSWKCPTSSCAATTLFGAWHRTNNCSLVQSWATKSDNHNSFKKEEWRNLLSISKSTGIDGVVDFWFPLRAQVLFKELCQHEGYDHGPATAKRNTNFYWYILGSADVATTAGGSGLNHARATRTVCPSCPVRQGSFWVGIRHVWWFRSLWQIIVFAKTMVHIILPLRLSRLYLPALSCLCLPRLYQSFSIAHPFVPRSLPVHRMSTEVAIEDPYTWLEDVEAEESLTVRNKVPVLVRIHDTINILSI